MNLIDTHAHLNFSHFKNDYKEVIERAQKEGVRAIINVGTSPKATKRAIEIAHEYEKGVYATVSVHPMYVKRHPDITEEDLIELAKDEKVIAVGETGFDFFYQPEMSEKQKKSLLKILEIAKKINKPVIFHSRDADDTFLEVMANYADDLKSGKLRAVKHCFTESADFAKKVLDLGMMISVNGLITFAREEQEKAVKSIPLERLMLETDCPYMTPVPHRGERNEPAYVNLVAQKIAELKNISVEEVAEKTTQNAKEFFGIELMD